MNTLGLNKRNPFGLCIPDDLQNFRETPLQWRCPNSGENLMSDEIQELEKQIEILKKMIAILEERVKRVEENLKKIMTIEGKEIEIDAEEWDTDKYNDYLRLHELKQELQVLIVELADKENRRKKVEGE